MVFSSSPRLYSDYLYFGLANKSVEDFHERVSESLQLLEACLSESSLRSCVYNTSLNVAMPVSQPAARFFDRDRMRRLSHHVFFFF